MTELDSTRRFSNRVEDYVRYRPDYPAEAIARLVLELRLAPGGRVADVGSGTGIFTRALLARGLEVFAVEPNREMRATAEAALGDNPRFHSVDGTAEKMPL